MHAQQVFAGLVMAGAIALGHAEIVINEIHHDPLENGLEDEFIELYNVGGEAVDVSGWRVSGAVSYTIPAETPALGAGGFLVLALNPSRAIFAGANALGPWEGRIGGDGERIVLRNAGGATEDEVEFEVRFPWPVAPAGLGPSMELINPSLGNNLGSSWRPSKGDPTPGVENSTFVENPPPNIRQVKHSPKQPKPDEEVTITVKLTDLDGVQNVALHYQVTKAGDYIPAYQPHTKEALSRDSTAPRRKFSRYAEGLFTGRWPVLDMEAVDPDRSDDDPDNDHIYTVTLPGQKNRTLVRYYITAEDGLGEKVRGPLKDDPNLNFAYFVYAGVPDWVADADSSQGNGQVYTSELLEQLPVYHLITRNEDWMECLAYSGSDQHPRERMDMRRYYNWSGTMVYDGEVYDNIAYRLRGGNGRYHLQGKRSMKFRFNRGNYFRVKDNRGRPYERKWRVLTTSKMYGNRLSGTFGTRNGPGNFGLIDTVNGQLWELFGVPAVRAHWFHFRVIDAVEEAPDQYGGDFYGLNLALERIDVRFLESRGLPKGNLYKLTDRISSGKDQQRYQAPNAVLNAADYLNIKNKLRSSRDEEWLRRYMNWDIWYRYTAEEEAIRHYDYWPEADKNMVYYFEPRPGVELGYYWQLPYDSDGSWGPSWNDGIDIPQNAVARKEVFQLELRNVIREFRDLVWQPEVIGPMVDDAAAVIEDFHPDDWDRWRKAPRATGQEDFGTLASKVADMKLFAFEGRLNYPGGSVPQGGRAKVLDDMADDNVIPKTPEVAFTGSSGYAVDALTFESSAYRYASIFTQSRLERVEWRVGETTDSRAPAYDPEAERVYEITKVWGTDSPDELSMAIPAKVLKVGHVYRVRARHWDITGRSSHWSAPHEFTVESPLAGAALQDSLVITEIMYHPSAADDAEAAAGLDESDFEYLELWNRGGAALDLTDLRFTKGVDFDFPEGTRLAPGAYGLIVASKVAMEVRHGSGLPILGEWESRFSLSNGGERVKLSFGAGNAVIDFRYDDAEPWPVSADGEGYALVPRDPVGMSDHGEASQWRASTTMGGTPGAGEGEGGEPDPAPGGFAAWLAEKGLTDAKADPDHDGITHAGAYAMAVDLLGEEVSSASALPWIETGADGVHWLKVRRRASGVRITVESSADLQRWTASGAQGSEPETQADGAVQVNFALGKESERYWRVRFSVE